MIFRIKKLKLKIKNYFSLLSLGSIMSPKCTMLVFVAAGVEGGEALLVGCLGRGLDMTGTVGAALDDGLAAIEAAVVLSGEVALEPFDRDDIFDVHEG